MKGVTIPYLLSSRYEGLRSGNRKPISELAELEGMTNLGFSHLDVGDSNTHAQDLFQLELDRRPNLKDLVLYLVLVSDEGRELAGLVQPRAKETGDLRNKGLGCKESIVPENSSHKPFGGWRPMIKEAINTMVGATSAHIKLC